MNIRLARAWLAGVVGLASLVGVSAVAQAQTATIIKGRVVSEAGMPLAGTSVFIDAIKAGAQTGEDGSYTITVAGRNRGPAVLVARRIGYRRAQSSGATVAAGDGDRVTAVLARLRAGLDGVDEDAGTGQRHASLRDDTSLDDGGGLSLRHGANADERSQADHAREPCAGQSDVHSVSSKKRGGKKDKTCIQPRDPAKQCGAVVLEVPTEPPWRHGL